MVTISILAVRSKKTRVIGFGLLWFLMALLPTSLFPLAEVMNDHRTFLPYIGLVIAMAGAGASLVAFDRKSGDVAWKSIALRNLSRLRSARVAPGAAWPCAAAPPPDRR